MDNTKGRQWFCQTEQHFAQYFENWLGLTIHFVLCFNSYQDINIGI